MSLTDLQTRLESFKDRFGVGAPVQIRISVAEARELLADCPKEFKQLARSVSDNSTHVLLRIEQLETLLNHARTTQTNPETPDLPGQPEPGVDDKAERRAHRRRTGSDAD
jgi:hypothetical protein